METTRGKRKGSGARTTDTRERVIESAITLMRRSGYSGAGINEILHDSGAPKGSLYHFFPDGKRQIASEALAEYARRVLPLYEQALSGGGSAGERVRRLLALGAARLEQGAFRHSCAAGCVSLDLDDEMAPVRQAVAHFFEQAVACIARHFDFGDAARTRAFAGLLMTTIEGAYVRGRAERSRAAFDEAAEWLAALAEHEAARGQRGHATFDESST